VRNRGSPGSAGYPRLVRVRSRARGRAAWVRGLVADLRAASDRFGDLWDANDVKVLHDVHKTIEHPELGAIELDCDVLTVDGADLRVVVFTAKPGTAAADSLALLASLDVDAVHAAGERG
jgi:MmyB-like transcription regulator ligand binding domain